MKIAHPVQVLVVPSGQTMYVELQCASATLTGFEVFWLDAVSSATLTLESTCRPSPHEETIEDTGIAGDATSGWTDEAASVPLTGPAASAAGTTGVKHVGNMGAPRMRVKVAAAADTTVYVAYAGKA